MLGHKALPITKSAWEALWKKWDLKMYLNKENEWETVERVEADVKEYRESSTGKKKTIME